MNITNKLILALLFVSMLPVMAVSLISSNLGQQALREYIGLSYQMLALEKAAAIDRVFEDRITELELLAFNNAIRGAINVSNASYGDQAPLSVILPLDKEWIAKKGLTKTADDILNNPLSTFLRLIQQRNLSKYGEMFITDRYGATVATTNRLSDYYQGDEKWWRSGYQGGQGEIFMDDRGFDKSVGSLVIGITVPIRSNDKVIGLFKVNYRVEDVLDIISDTRPGQSSRIYMARGYNGDIIVGSTAERLEQLQKNPGDLISQTGWRESQYGATSTIMAYAKPRTIFFHRKIAKASINGGSKIIYTPTQWLIFVEIDQEEAFAAVDRMAKLFLYVALVALMIVVVVAWRLSHSITNPLKNLIRSTEVIGGGNLDHKVEVHANDEIGALSHAFNGMTERLKSVTASRAQLRQEIEARRLAEAHETRLGRIIDNTTNEIYLFDSESLLFSEANAGALANIGYSQDELRLLTPVDLKPAFTIKTFRTEIEPLLQYKKKYIEFDTYHRRKDGTTYPVLVRLELFTEETPAVFVAIILDTTTHKAAEEKLRKASQKLLDSNKELQNFAYVVSHDLQEPLRMVSSYMSLLERRYADQLDDDANEFIEYAVDGAARMSGLIDGLLQYSRVQTQGESFQSVAMEDIFQSVLKDLKLSIAENEAIITHDSLPVLHADKSQLGRVLQNLISNSLKFRKETVPTIHVGVEKRDKEFVFSIRDNGIGIEEQYYQRIFVIFQRLHTREEYPGSGIGLALCRRIVERHGGTIWVESTPGAGAIFFFSLPFDDEE